MRIADVLRNKGAAVVTINPEATVRELLAGLAEQNIGAMVVVGAQVRSAGLVVSVMAIFVMAICWRSRTKYAMLYACRLSRSPRAADEARSRLTTWSPPPSTSSTEKGSTR